MFVFDIDKVVGGFCFSLGNVNGKWGDFNSDWVRGYVVK